MRLLGVLVLSVAVVLASCGAQQAESAEEQSGTSDLEIPFLGFPVELPTQLTSASHGGDALDFSTAPVAVADGVAYVECGGSRLLIDIGPGSGIWASYYHVHRLVVDDGEAVQAGMTLGRLAQTETDALGCEGIWDAPHVHFELYAGRPAADEWDGIASTAYALGGWVQDPQALGREGALVHPELGRRSQWSFIAAADAVQ